jgi:regulator of protease activity HflC (stomatin/prohibitin superfamily)
VALLIVFGVIVVILALYLSSAIRIVRPNERGVVERLGRFHGVAQPGLRVIFPMVDRIRRVDMREQVVDVPPQEVITKDNVVVAVDAVVFYEPTDPQRLVYNIANFILAVTKLAQTNLRNVIGDMQLDEALTSREHINTQLRSILDDATDKWGVRVVRVEIQRIDPPPDVMHSMHEQMKSERTRRAVVTTAEGERTAAITRAEGERQAAVLSAQGQKEAQVLRATGEAEAIRQLGDAERYRLEAVANGQAEATRVVYHAILETEPTPELLAIKYLEALQGVAQGPATTVIVPTEMAGIAGALAGIAPLFRESRNGRGGASERPPTVGPVPPPPPMGAR